MTDSNSINIGGVKFNKNDVAKSEVIKQEDGVLKNSVFLKDGTHIVYPNQSAKNESLISIHSNDDSGNPENKEFTVDFYRISNAEIIGTERKDDYILHGCKDSKVDVSQKDNKRDSVKIKDDDTNVHQHYNGRDIKNETQHSRDGHVLFSGKNEVKQNFEDSTFLHHQSPDGKRTLYDQIIGKGTVSESERDFMFVSHRSGVSNSSKGETDSLNFNEETLSKYKNLSVEEKKDLYNKFKNLPPERQKELMKKYKDYIDKIL